MIQDMQRSTNAVTGIPTTNMTIFPLNDKPALYALEKDLASQPDLRKNLVSCFLSYLSAFFFSFFNLWLCRIDDGKWDSFILNS